ncbi:DUF4395 domain-containing protein [bacterium]|nr:DUF4395 domain-containing protein [bacterium]
MPTPEQVRNRLEIQGYGDLDDSTLAELGPWIRWSPAFCTVFMIAGTALASPAILWTLAATAFVGAILPSHPFDWLYNFGFRHLTGTRPLPPHGAPRRFACAIATVWLIATGAAFSAGAMTAGYALGTVLASVAALVSVTHICIPSHVYRALFTPRLKAAD